MQKWDHPTLDLGSRNWYDALEDDEVATRESDYGMGGE